ncbi:MAG: FecCD family ABC transporter permease [Parvibaculaceae bacterium]
MTSASDIAPVAGPLPGDRRRKARTAVLLLACAAAVAAIASLSLGPASLSLADLWSAVFGGEAENRHAGLILYDIRLPRTVLGLFVGAALGVAGGMMQGLFRNPLADPGLVGVSAGAALAATTAIFLGGRLLPAGYESLSPHLVSLAAFGGGLVTTVTLYVVATREGRTSVATMLLAGIALGALAASLTGLIVFLADDRTLRDITFWSLGSLGGGTWNKAFAAGLLIVPVLAVAPMIGNALNALQLGEAEAAHLGIEVERTKRLMILLVAAAVGAAVAVSGVIGFIGLVVPHLLRLSIGPDNRFLLPAAGLLGATLLVGADIVARTIVTPAELPIGIVTAAVGAPFFLWLVLKQRGILDL